MLSSYPSLLMLFSYIPIKEYYLPVFPTKTNLKLTTHTSCSSFHLSAQNTWQGKNKRNFQFSLRGLYRQQRISTSTKKSIIGKQRIENLSFIKWTLEKFPYVDGSRCRWYTKQRATGGTQQHCFCWKPKGLLASLSSFGRKPALSWKAPILCRASVLGKSTACPTEPRVGAAVHEKTENHTHPSPSSQSDSESADWKHTCKSERADMCWLFIIYQYNSWS